MPVHHRPAFFVFWSGFAEDAESSHNPATETDLEQPPSSSFICFAKQNAVAVAIAVAVGRTADG